ncbi:MAG: hypothetical protein Q8P41_13735 [Pseudomonadota bacterium]|nr:hypothetical protein [Pseudomonadota bacterium]
MLIFLSLLACSPDPTQASAPDMAVDVADSADARAPVSRTAATHVYSALPDVDGFVEIRAYREVAGELVWAGVPLVSEVIDDATTRNALPAVPPPLDRLDPADPVTYAITVRATDRRGNPSVYLGIAEPRLVYVPVDPPAGAVVGWNLAVNYGEDDVTWLPMTQVLNLDENLVGLDGLDLAGFTGLTVGPDSRIAVMSSVAGAPSVYDGPFRLDWGVSLAAPPPTAALEDIAFVGTALTVYTYEDVDGDGLLTTEPVTGEACAVGGAAVVTWYQHPRTLHAAMSLAQRGLRGGWGVGTLGEDGLVAVPSERHAALAIDTACE